METYRCEKKCAEEPTEHEFISEHGDYNEIYEIRCKHCQNQYQVSRKDWFSHQLRHDIRPSRAYLTRWPKIEPHTGEWVKSREHEREVTKAMGYTEQRHAIDVKQTEHKKIRTDRNLWGS